MISDCGASERSLSAKSELKIATPKLTNEQLNAIKTLTEKRVTSTQKTRVTNKDKKEFARICKENVSCVEQSIFQKEFLHFNGLMKKFCMVLDSNDMDIKAGTRFFEDFSIEDLLVTSTALRSFKDMLMKSVNKIESFMIHMKKYTVKKINKGHLEHFFQSNIFGKCV